MEKKPSAVVRLRLRVHNLRHLPLGTWIEEASKLFSHASNGRTRNRVEETPTVLAALYDGSRRSKHASCHDLPEHAGVLRDHLKAKLKHTRNME